MSFIIVEGGDGTGKTTLAEELAEQYGAEYEHVGPPRDDMTPFAEHIEYAFVLAEQYGSVVFDRFHLGCFAYGPVWRPENDVDGIGDFRRADWDLFEHLISSRCLLVVCDPGWKIVQDNLSGRDGTQPLAQYENDLAKVIAVYDRFRKAYEFSILDKYKYDYNDPYSRKGLDAKIEEVLRWVPISTSTICEHYPTIIDELRAAPIVGSRGGRTREMIDYSLVLRGPARCIVNRVGFSRRFMDAEIAMLLAGVYDGDLLTAITPKAAELLTPLTAYGPRVRHQLPLIVDELKANPESRRAVVYVGRHTDLESISGETAGEMPCTMTWQFLLRGGLHMIVNMRSWGAVWGLSYDVPSFVAVQAAVAKALRAPLGTYRHHAGSFHLYERHWNMEVRTSRDVLELDWLGDSWDQTVSAAEAFVEIYRMGAIKRAVEAFNATN